LDISGYLRDIAMMNKTLSHIKPEWHDEILATVNDSSSALEMSTTLRV
jgi:hypothetical protein